MEILFKIFNEYGWWGILGIVICIGLYWMSKYISKKLTNNVTTGLEQVGKTLTDQLTKQNDKLTNTIVDQQNKLINYLVHIEDKKQENHNNMLNERMVLSEDINQSLKNIMTAHGAQRAFILEFHNSYQNLSGVPFAKYSCNYEWFERGLSPLGPYCMGIAFSSIAKIVSNVIESPNQQVVYTDMNKLDEENPIVSGLLKDKDVKGIVYTGLYDNNNILIGLLVIEYNKEIKPSEINLYQLSIQAAEITSLLNIRYKYTK